MRSVLTTILMGCFVLAGGVIYLGYYYPHLLDLSRPEVRDIAEIRARISPSIERRMAARGMKLGAPVYMRIFKEEHQLELWTETETGYELFRTYPICNYSGELGPKLRQGDRQSPEGFYKVSKGSLNPNSSFHLSFNLGYPNRFDRAHGRTGDFLMVHGACSSIGCYAMTDPLIEEIYVIAEAALNNGQAAFDVHAFPFRLSAQRLADAGKNKWHSFWTDMAPAFTHFEATRQIPKIAIRNKRYEVQI